MERNGRTLEGTFRRECRLLRQAINEDTRSVELSFSSEEPYERWFGSEVLGHKPSEVRMDRLKSGTHPLLLQHDANQQIGVIEKAWLDGEELKGRALVRFAPPTNKLAEEIYQDVLAGIRSLISVGYRVHRFKEHIPLDEEGQPDETNTEYRAIDWEPFEVSVVSIPADTTVGIGKEQKVEQPAKEPEKTEKEPPAEKPPEKELAQPQILTRKYMAEPDQKDRIELEEKQAREKAEAEARQREERLAFIKKQADDRVKEIYAIGSRFGAEKLKQQAIEEGWSIDKFRSVLLESMDEGKIIRQPDTETGNQDQKSIGELFVDSPMYRELAKRIGTRRNITLDIPRTSFQERVFVANTEGLTSIQKLAGVPGLLDQQLLRVAQIIPTTTTDALTIRYIREDTYTNAAAGVSENAEKAEITLDVSEVDATVCKIAVYLITTDEMLADYSQMRGFIDGRLSYMVAAREEDYILNGTGTAPQIRGLFNVVGINTYAAGGAASMVAAVGQAINQVRVNGHVEPDAIVLHPTDWTNFRLTTDTNGQFYGGGPFQGAYGVGGFTNVGAMWGLPVVTTTFCTQGTGLVGAFRIGSQIFRKQGIMIEASNSDYDNFRYNRVTVRAEARMTLACYKPLAFCEITGIA